MTPENRAAILKHAREEAPREACGLLVMEDGREVYRPCRNLGAGLDLFVLDPHDYAAAALAGEITAVVHSHPGDDPSPSPTDRIACQASGHPWLIVATDSGLWRYLEPDGTDPQLLGRSYIWGVLDCYTLARDWYAQNGIALPDFYRPEDKDYWLKEDDLFARNFHAAGFREVPAEDMQPGDGLLFQIAAPVENHCAVYIGDNRIIHHAHNRLSVRETYGELWRRHTVRVLRHENNRSIG